MSQQLFALALVKAGKTSDNLLNKFILSSLLPERWGDKFLSDGGPVKLGFEWGGWSFCGELTEKQLGERTPSLHLKK